MTAIVGEYESRLESINKLINRIADRERPMLKMFLDLSNPVDNVKHEWVNKALKGFEDTLASALTSTTPTVVTLNGGTNAPKRIIDNVTHLRLGTELMLVVSTITVVTNSTKVCVQRGYLSTTPATYSANTRVRLLHGGRSEGFDADRDDSQKGVRDFNYSQIWDRQLKLSGTSLNTNTVEKESRMDKQAAELMPEILKDMEGALLNNVARNADANTLDNRVSGGFPYWATSIGGDNNEDMGGAAIDIDLIEDIIEAYLSNGGDAQKMGLVVPVRQQRKINDLKEAKVIGNVAQSETTLNNFVNRYDFGGKAQVDIMCTTDLAPDEVYFFQKDNVKVKPFKGRALSREPLAKTGDNERELMVGEYVFEFHNPRETLFRKYNLAT